MKPILNALAKSGLFKRAFAVLALCAATAPALPAQTFTNLLDFDYTDGAYPYYAGLIQGDDGNLYGTSAGGGANGYGTVFKITPNGTLTTLHTFCSEGVYPYCTDGYAPYAGLIQTADGDLYGTTYWGGTASGTIFRITPSGTLTTLYTFCSLGNCTDGGHSLAGLIQAADGNLYGTTSLGGTYGSGTIFKIALSGTLTTLYSFCAQTPCPDGDFPAATLVQAANGDFYGTTVWGGTSENCPTPAIPYPTCGTVFKITSGGTFTSLHSFVGTDGENPYGGLIEAASGDLYGTTSGGGNSSAGTVFKIAPGGTFSTLASLDSTTTGAYPYAGLIQATNGYLYGTASGGGANGDYGTIFKMTPSGTLTPVFSFDGANGLYPFAEMVQDTGGDFYAPTYGGGGNATCSGYDGCGTIFSLSVGLEPFVETRPTSGSLGETVEILGTNLTSPATVAFNGTPAEILYLSPTEIRTTVPLGASTGRVEVTTHGGTLTSNVPFRVLPSGAAGDRERRSY